MPLIIGDSIQEIKNIKGEVQTWIIDPPYNIGFKYESSVFVDKFDNYEEWIQTLSSQMFDKAKDGGSMFFIHYPAQAARLLPYLEAGGWELNQWLSWVYPSNVGMSKRRFTTAHRAVLWFKKGEPYFNHTIKGQYRDKKDPRIIERMNQGHSPALYDWLQINLCKNVSKEHAGYFNQIPSKLLKILILNTSREGDLIADPCAGSCSTLKVALDNNREAWGCDINPNSKIMFDDYNKQTKLKLEAI